MSAGNVVALCPPERVIEDDELIATIYRNLGSVSAEQVVTRALAELAMAMAGLAAQIRKHDLADVDRQLRRLQRMSENLGMVSLGLIAGDVRMTLARNDVTAFAAVWARLMRVAERSLSRGRDVLGTSQI